MTPSNPLIGFFGFCLVAVYNSFAIHLKADLGSFVLLLPETMEYF